MKNGEKRFLKCKVSDGMFEGEKIVVVESSKGATISAIVNKKSVVNSHEVKVEVCGKNKTDYLVRLPGESFSTPRKVWVSEKSLDLK